jgi:signal transduction histidine kinase
MFRGLRRYTNTSLAEGLQRYSVALLVAVLATALAALLHMATHSSAGYSAVTGVAVVGVAWFLTLRHALLTTVAAVLGEYAIFDRSLGLVGRVDVTIAERLLPLIAIACMVSCLRYRVMAERRAAEQNEATAAHFIAQLTQTEQERGTEVNKLSLELRTLAGVIRVRAELLTREDVDAKSQRASAEDIREATDRLSTLANELKEAARTEAAGGL